MDYGLILPTMTEGASAEGVEAGVHYYPTTDLFDATLGEADTGGPFDLALCPSAGQSCQVVGPRLLHASLP